MNDTYTIIDNFDKLDLHALLHGAYSDPEGNDPKTTLSQLHWAQGHETINDDMSKNTDTGMNVWNYVTPYNFSDKFVFIPDMLRYITGRKFYIDWAVGSDLSIKYPSESLMDNATFPVELAENHSLFKYNYFFDITNAASNLYINNLFFANSLGLRDYYEPSFDLFFIATFPAILKSSWTYEDIEFLKFLGETEIFKTDGFKTGLIEGKRIRNQVLFGLWLKNGPSMQRDVIPFFPLFENVSNAKDMIGKFERTNHAKGEGGFRDLLQKLLLFQKQSNPPDPESPNANLLRHLYFVTDLPKGTNKISPEFEYILNTNVVVINSQYNYYTDYSENFASSMTELQLPNLYTYYAFRTKKSNYYETLVRLGQSTPGGVSPEEFSIRNYYNLIASSQLYPLPQPEADVGFPTETVLSQALAPYRYRNIVVSSKNYLKDANSIAKVFPFYNKITLPRTKSAFMKLMADKKFTDNFMSLLGNYFSSVRNPESSIHKFVLHNGRPPPNTALTMTYLQIMDLTRVFKDAAAHTKYLYDDKNVKFGFKSPNLKSSANDESSIETALLQALDVPTREYFKKKLLDPDRIYEGEKCHTEVLAYEIAKFKLDSNGDKAHVQSIFMPSLFSGDLSELDEVTYLDTQIFYGQTYIYEIFTHSLIIGTKYIFERNYTDPYYLDETAKVIAEATGIELSPYNKKQIPYEINLDPTDGSVLADLQRLKLPVVASTPHEPVALVVRAPYYNNTSLSRSDVPQKVTYLVDKPPLPPDIVFYPYKDDDSKILILLNVNYGERRMPAVRVFDTDNDKIYAHAMAQENENNIPGYLIYKSDDAQGNFLIYRTTNKPTSWADFINSDLKVLNARKNTGYQDVILPNTDYYYFARLEDVHENISNPTAIFHVRIVKEGGFPPYVIREIYNFTEGKPKSIYEKSFKKYLNIRLPDAGRSIAYMENEDVREAVVGYVRPDDKQLKKYKVRITSQKTGKKIDINIDFSKTTNTDYLDKPGKTGVDNEVGIDPSTLGNEQKIQDIVDIEGTIGNPMDSGPGADVTDF